MRLSRCCGLPDMYERFRCQGTFASQRGVEDERYLKGPVPLAWLETAAKLRGRSLHVGLVLWYAAGLSRSASVHLSNVLCSRFGIDRNAKYRALHSLEDAGLVAVKRKRGRSPLVIILECSSTR
jgi:hypothetical protein